MSRENVRIAVSGAPGTGKSTLVSALAEKLDVPVIPENMVDLADLDREFVEASMGTSALRAQAAGKRFAEAALEWHRDRTAQFERYDAFIADRWHADLLDWWLIAFARNASAVDAITQTLIEGMAAASTRLHLAVTTPLQAPFDSGLNDEGNQRAVTMTKHVLSNVVITGSIQRFTSVPLFEMPVGRLSVEQRVDRVLERYDLVTTGSLR